VTTINSSLNRSSPLLGENSDAEYKCDCIFSPEKGKV
jgi:hypothetical protein